MKNMAYPQFIDNSRKKLSNVLNEIAPKYKVLRIATGYWDLAGTLELINDFDQYNKIQLLIGKEPIAHRLQTQYNIDMAAPENLFPDADIKHDLQEYGNSEELEQLRDTAKKLVKLMKSNTLEVKIYRTPRLHAKAYIFGELGDADSVGIIGSSNFTRAGLTSNAELNFLTEDYHIVEFKPTSDKQQNGHIVWFDELWQDAEEWTGEFSQIIIDSPVGDFTYGAYDVYIKTLMEVFPEELQSVDPFDKDIEEILHPFQNQNALDLRRKLDRLGVAMLSDSVGLGKTITAAAIIKQYIEDGQDNICIIPPASLKRQWIDELEGERWNLREGKDFRIISQQDSGRIQEQIEYFQNHKSTRSSIDLFVIDEAHNLRNQGSSRYQQILELFQENPQAKILLLTATPINNSLMDFANQIQLGSKGDLVSLNVPYISKKGSNLEYIDFFEALKRIQSEATRAEKRGEQFDWDFHRNTLVSGIRHYLVRSTRQGVIKNEQMNLLEGQTNLFPTSTIEQFPYSYLQEDDDFVYQSLLKAKNTMFENMSPTLLNLDLASELTQRTSHPLDLYRKIAEEKKSGIALSEKYGFSNKFENESIFLAVEEKLSVIPAIFKAINFLGFAPYKPDTYSYEIYNKTISEIRALNKKGNEAGKLRTQLAIHNMLHITWLKRLESSTATLKKSVKNYQERISLFEKWLNKGYIVSLTDAATLDNEYGEDIDKAFEDYEKYLSELDEAVSQGTEQDVKKRGIEKKEADESIYNISQLKIDIQRDKNICAFLIDMLTKLEEKGHDGKLNAFVDAIVKRLDENKYGKKLLVFSFFSDTIDYLRERLPEVLEDRIPNFSRRAEFVSGNSTAVEDVSKRFSPNSKKAHVNKQDELDFLFATDVLSEGQNLQDAGFLVNYDLHWNPVRMIQRNGRINRLGSTYDNILIANVKPHADLEFYLKLVRRLEHKIATINNTVGNDQSILGEKENPIEFHDMTGADVIYDDDSEKASKAMEDLQNTGDILDWADNYSIELRKFLDAHKDDGEIQRIQNIPEGKWNYLPKSTDSSENPDEVLGLYRAKGKVSATGALIKDIGFVSIAKSAANRGPYSSIRAGYIQEQYALQIIQTTPDDNERLSDEIAVNRSEYIAKGKTEISVNFESIAPVYSIKQQGNRALEIIKGYFDPSYDLVGIIKKGIRYSNDKRTFEQIVREVNKQNKEYGAVTPRVIKDFEALLNKLLLAELEEKKLEKVEGVLFYAKP